MIKRSIMTLYSGPLDPYSHQTRIVLAEKGVNVDILNVNSDQLPEDLLDVNPYGSLPTLVDRELVLYQAGVIMEYLDERFPHPPLLPVYPIARAKSRLMMHRIDNDWYALMMAILTKPDTKKAEKAREELREGLLALSPVFAEMKYFLSEDFTLVDCVLAPLLWRLQHMEIKLTGKHVKPIAKYAESLFARDSFQVSLTEAERDLRNGDKF